MRPDTTYECTQDYQGTTREGKPITLTAGTNYLKTTGPKFIYLNLYDDPSTQLPWLEPDEFQTLAAQYLKKTGDLGN